MLFALAFLNGFALMILEMSGARLLAPHVGTSIIVWTSLIGIILASLSIGNWLGGIYADRVTGSSNFPAINARINDSFQHNGSHTSAFSALAKLFIACSVFVFFTALVQSDVFSLTKVFSSLYIRTVAVTLILFAPPGILCGMISPFITKLAITGKEKSGNIIGKISAMSTLGSIAGTFLGGFVLVSWFGTIQILYGVAFIFLLGSLITGRYFFIAKTGLALCLLTAMGFHTLTENSAHNSIHLRSPYNTISILTGTMEGRSVTLLQTDPGSCQSGQFTHAPFELIFPYTHYYDIGPRLLPQAQRILMLGGGGYSIPKWILAEKSSLQTKDFLLDVVELDPVITQAAVKYFNLQKNDSRLNIFHEDARTYLNRSASIPTYDLIFADVFNSYYSIPFHMGTKEAAARMSSLLANNGLLIMNIISAVDGDNGRLLRGIYSAFSAEFTSTRLYLVQQPDAPSEVQNLILVASHKEQSNLDFLVENDPKLKRYRQNLWNGVLSTDVLPLTDNFAPVERYTLNFLR